MDLFLNISGTHFGASTVGIKRVITAINLHMAMSVMIILSFCHAFVSHNTVPSLALQQQQKRTKAKRQKKKRRLEDDESVNADFDKQNLATTYADMLVVVKQKLEIQM